MSCVNVNYYSIQIFETGLLFHYRYTFTDMEVDNFIQNYDSNKDHKVSIDEITSKSFEEEVRNGEILC